MRLRGCLSPDPKEKLLLMRTTEEQNNCQTCPAGGFKTMCGGQALIEGIMMRGPKKQAIVVRKPDGELAVKESQLKFIKDRYPVLGLPLVRGVVTFCASMVEGVKALMFSAEFYPEDEEAEPEEPSKFELWLEKRLGSEKMASLVVTLAVILGIGMSIGLFFLLPTLLGTAVTVVTDSMLVRNVAESLLKLAIFVGYLALCSRMKDIHRVFEYHGAEHKTIACYEADDPLTPENAMKHSRLHPRCGTNYLFLVMAVSIVFFAAVGWNESFWLRLLSRIVFLPLVAGISYEVLKLAAKYENIFTKIIRAPGMALQYITTKEPTADMLEVAIASFNLAMSEPKEAMEAVRRNREETADKVETAEALAGQA